MVVSRESHAQVVTLLWAIHSSSRESHAIIFQNPTTKKSLLGGAQKVITQKARFSLEKRGKTFIFRQPTLSKRLADEKRTLRFV